MGAFIGPVIVFVLTYFSPLCDTLSSYRKSFTFLLIPALITIALVFYSWRRYPHPEVFEKEEKKERMEFKIKPSFVLFMAAISLFAFGFADFSLISLSAMEKDIFPSSISLLYALEMAVDAVAALVFGFLYDKIGIKSLIAATVLSSFFPFFAFLSSSRLMMMTGIVLWGIGMGAEESIMKASVASIIPKDMRSTGFGVFETLFGVFWFLVVGCAI